MSLCRFFLWFKNKYAHTNNTLFFVAPIAFVVSVIISLLVPSLHRLAPLYIIPISMTLFFLCVPDREFIGKYRITQVLFNLSKYTLAFYLVHQVALRYTQYIFDIIGVDSFIVYAPVSLLLSGFLSWIMYNCFELRIKQGNA